MAAKKDDTYIVGPGQVDIKPPQVPNYPVRQAAERDVSLFNQPVLQEIAGQANQVRDSWKEQDVASRNIHQGLMNEMNALPGVGQQYNEVAGGLNQHLGGLTAQAGDFGRGPAGEFAADGQMFGQMGASAQAALAGQRARSQDWTRGVQSQAHVDLASRRANYLETMRDEIQKLQEKRMGVFQTMPEQMKQRVTELDDQRFQQGLGLWESGMQAEQMASDDELRAALIDMLGDKAGGAGGGAGGGGGGGNSGGGGKGGRSYEQLLKAWKKAKKQGGGAGKEFLNAHPKFKDRVKNQPTGGTGSGPTGNGPKGSAGSTSKRKTGKTDTSNSRRKSQRGR